MQSDILLFIVVTWHHYMKFSLNKHENLFKRHFCIFERNMKKNKKLTDKLWHEFILNFCRKKDLGDLAQSFLWYIILCRALHYFSK